MKRKLFFKRLTEKLNSLASNDIDEVIKYYDKIITKRVSAGEKEQKIILSFGSIDEIANNIINNKNKKRKIDFKKILNVFKINRKKKIKIIKKETNKKKVKQTKINNRIKNDISKGEKSLLGIFGTALLVFLVVLVTLSSALFMISVFAVLDGVKLIGLCLSLLVLTVLSVLLLSYVNKIILRKHVEFKKYFISFLISIVLLGCGIGLTIIEIYRFDYINDPTIDFQMTRVENSFDLYEDGVVLHFNSWYRPDYTIKFDNTIKDEFVVEVKYYESYYDYFNKRDNNNIYVSLSEGLRDKMSFYIENLKDGKIYNRKELSRYTITIYVNKEDRAKIKTEISS